MKADVKLTDQNVLVEGGPLIVQSGVVHVDVAERRDPGGHSNTRRALLHDDGDILTINPGRDYPHGTRVFGTLFLQSARAQDAVVDELTVDELHLAKKLVVKRAISVPIIGPDLKPKGEQHTTVAVDLVELIFKLQDRIDALENKLAGK